MEECTPPSNDGGPCSGSGVDWETMTCQGRLGQWDTGMHIYRQKAPIQMGELELCCGCVSTVKEFCSWGGSTKVPIHSDVSPECGQEEYPEDQHLQVQG